ncbi:putative nuclear transport factor 2 [Pyronema domesticum]|uniref:NTF2-related export protein n=1 Tax=Pyronema omphalodes (strain CBS 100304) TaxID=1076935 RepID=U4L065_PYROM|nr:putative nuclear transport factor 2 [Pyronema domesticum]CCX07919.1 Similar to NTF2-related export protein 1; acc. no. Q9QZV9 [Pyronema omphalodes CBS 100304]
MTTPAKDAKLIKTASDAARRFVESYYPALNDNRSSLDTYYYPDAAITWNGNAILGGGNFATFFATMPTSHYDVQSFDAHPVAVDAMGNCSVMLNVSGSVKYGESKEMRGFGETVILRPEEGNPTKFKISAQGFRLVSG